MEIEIGARSDVGRVRNQNEDSYKVLAPLNLFVLSDGMGGESHGEVASALAVETVATHCQEASNNVAVPFYGEHRASLTDKTNRLGSAVRLANRRIREAAQEVAARKGMGATILAAWVDGPRLSLVHVGDSRAYLLRTGVMEQLTSPFPGRRTSAPGATDATAGGRERNAERVDSCAGYRPVGRD